MLSIVT